MVITHNLMASNAMRQYNLVGNAKQKSTEKLSSGYKINRAADDAAGLSISEKMRWQIRGLNRGAENAQDGISFCQVADGAMHEMHDMIQRMRELSVQAANDTYTELDRKAIQDEIDSISTEFGRIVETTDFNEQSVFGKERTVTVTEESGTGEPTVIDSETYSVTGTKYGLANVLGENNMSSSPIMTTIIYNLSSSQWKYTDGTHLVKDGRSYVSSWMNFSGMGKDFTKEDLYGLGFNTSCRHGCGMHYSIQFTDGNDGTQYTNLPAPSASYNISEGTGYYSDKTLKIDISNLSSGEEIVLAIYNSAATAKTEDGSSMIDHWTQFAYNPKDPTTLYLFDNKNQTGQTFEPVARNIEGEVISPTTVTRHDNTGRTYTYEDKDLWIHTSQEQTDGIMIQKAWIVPESMGLYSVNVMSDENAKYALDILDNALDIVSTERGRMGAYTNRFEHTINNNLITSENTQAAESKIRDTDMAEEMMRNATQNILASAGEAMISQANMSNQGVLSLLQ